MKLLLVICLVAAAVADQPEGPSAGKKEEPRDKRGLLLASHGLLTTPGLYAPVAASGYLPSVYASPGLVAHAPVFRSPVIAAPGIAAPTLLGHHLIAPAFL